MNIVRLRKSADRMIRGASQGAVSYLVRDGIKRRCSAARVEFAPKERGLYLEGTERFYISSLNLQVPPDFEKDRLEFKGVGQPAKRYRFTMEPGGPRPNGIVVYYDCPVMYIETVS